MDVGSHVMNEVNRMRSESGRWPLQIDDRLSWWAWAHTQWMLSNGIQHAHLDNRQVENIFQGSCQNPYGLVNHFIHHGDHEHRGNFLREDVCAQGVAVYTREYFDRYQMILTWRALRND